MATQNAVPLYVQILETQEEFMVQLDVAAETHLKLQKLQEAQDKRQERIQNLGRAIAPQPEVEVPQSRVVVEEPRAVPQPNGFVRLANWITGAQS